MKRLLLHLAGVPAAGKSTFARWLQVQKGFVHIDVDILAPLGILTGNAPEIVGRLRHCGQRVVIDWGFRPASLPLVKDLSAEGVISVWLDADHQVARIKFIERKIGS